MSAVDKLLRNQLKLGLEACQFRKEEEASIEWYLHASLIPS